MQNGNSKQPDARHATTFRETPTPEKIFMMPLTAETAEQLHSKVERWTANMLYLPCLCTKSVCRRTGTCSANPQDCIRRLGPLVPKDVQEGIQWLLEGKMEVLSYDELRAEAPLEIQDYEDWIALVQRAATRGRPKAKKVLVPSQIRELRS